MYDVYVYIVLNMYIYIYKGTHRVHTVFGARMGVYLSYPTGSQTSSRRSENRDPLRPGRRIEFCSLQLPPHDFFFG